MSLVQRSEESRSEEKLAENSESNEQNPRSLRPTFTTEADSNDLGTAESRSKAKFGSRKTFEISQDVFDFDQTQSLTAHHADTQGA